MFGPFFLAIAEPFLPECGQLADPPTNICSVIPAQTKHTHFLPLLCLPPQFALNFPFPYFFFEIYLDKIDLDLNISLTKAFTIFFVFLRYFWPRSIQYQHVPKVTIRFGYFW